MPETTTDTVWTVKRWHGAGTHAAGAITWENADALGHTGATSCPIRLPEGFTYGDGARIRVIVEVVHDEPATIAEAWTWRDLPGQAYATAATALFGSGWSRLITPDEAARIRVLADEWLAGYFTGTSPTDAQLADVRASVAALITRNTTDKIAPTIATAPADR